ncbi:protein GVQW3-like [Lycorma delicatula]|uniref:protein GVQW3-like n=1 Tax=Lycorma delicatula TaxID=130591 RepID=UPI003F514BE9
MIKIVYGSQEMSCKNIFKWFARFREGKTSTENDPRPSSSITVRTEGNVQVVAEILRNDGFLSAILIEKLTGIPKSTVHVILKENLGKRKACARFVPHILTVDQKYYYTVEHCRDMKRTADMDQTSCQET